MTQFVSGSVLTASSLNTAFNTATIATATTNYTLGSVNAGELVLLNSAGAGTVTIPLDATYNFATGTIIEMYNSGAGSWSIATAGTASTVSGSSTTLSQYQASRLIKTAPSTWFVDGGAGAANAVLKTGTSSTSGTMDFSGSVVKGAGLDLITPTSIANSGGSASASGGAVTFTGVSSISLNGVFTSNYDNYRVVISDNFGNGASGVYVYIRLRTSGTDNSAANYRYQYIYRNDAGTIGGAGSTSATSIETYVIRNDQVSEATLDILTPQLAKFTGYTGLLRSFDNLLILGGTFAATTQFDGFTVYPASGTLSATIRVYGYKN